MQRNIEIDKVPNRQQHMYKHKLREGERVHYESTL